MNCTLNYMAALKRIDILRMLSDSTKPFCNCCSVDKSWAMTIDHINGNGNKHRNEVGYTTTWVLVAREVRAGASVAQLKEVYQVLCAQCNHGKRINNGVCPHTNERLQMKQNIINALASYGKIFGAAVIAAYMASGKAPFTVGSDDVKNIISAGVGAVLPVIYNALNPDDMRYGFKKDITK